MLRVVAAWLVVIHAAYADPIDSAPAPGNESGRIDPIDEGDSVPRLVGRTILWVPRLAFDVVWLPVHGAFYLTDRYHVERLYYRVFYNANETIGLVPVVVFQSGFGLSIGARFVASDVLGEHEHLSLQATTGVGFREQVSAHTDTGKRLGDHFAIGIDGSFDRRPNDPFYGIGNGDDTRVVPPMPVDPRTDPTSYQVGYRDQEERVAVTAEVKPTKQTRIRATGSLTQISYDPSSNGIVKIGEVYDLATIPGFEGGVQHAYAELGLRWDTRDRSSIWESPNMFSCGSLVDVFAGRVDRLDGGRDFWRYGAELQHFFKLASGPRMLITRLHASGVTGSRDDVPFTELAMLGGGDFLRGYSYNRFRDRAAAFGSLQYEWDLSHFTAAYLFSDFGRVWESFEDVTARGLRVGYGIGIDVHGESSFLFTASVASSIDGGLFLNFAFNQPINGLQQWR